MTEILITGSHGFIGSHLTKEIDKPRIISLNEFNASEILIKKLEGVGKVIHLGALIRGTEEEQMAANVGNTKVLLEAISKLNKKPDLFIFASTFAVYAVQSEFLTEKSILGPRNGYGKSKLAAEKVVEQYAKKLGMQALILRFSNVYGPGMPSGKHSVVSNFIYAAIEGEPIKINGDGNQKRDFVYIDDLVKALLKALSWQKKDGQAEIINICTGEAVTLNQLAEAVGVNCGDIKIDRTNPLAVEEGCWIGCNEKARKILGWKPEISICEGVKITYEEAKK
jgi:nucleoside-diphosphate-sugar epimerase